MMSDIIERLHGPDGMEAAQEILRLREENGRLREALRPFATAAHSNIDSKLNLIHAVCSLTPDDFRRARAAIREGENDEIL